MHWNEWALSWLVNAEVTLCFAEETRDAWSPCIPN